MANKKGTKVGNVIIMEKGNAISENSGFRVALDAYGKKQKFKTGKMVLDTPQKIYEYLKELNEA